MNNIIAVAAATIALSAVPAHALKLVLTGVATVDPVLGIADLPVPWPGGLAQGMTYEVTVQLSRPANWLNVSYLENYSFWYCDVIVGWCGGDDYDQYFNIGATASNFATGRFVTGKDKYTVTRGPGGIISTLQEYYNVAPLYFDNEFAGTDPVGYRIALQSVPEPASWALLIAGFGMVGSSLRTRRRALAS